MKILTLTMVTIPSGCTAYGGLAVHRPDDGIGMSNPIGFIGGEAKIEDFAVFIEHHGGMLHQERGRGYTLVGARVEYNFYRLEAQ